MVQDWFITKTQHLSLNGFPFPQNTVANCCNPNCNNNTFQSLLVFVKHEMSVTVGVVTAILIAKYVLHSIISVLSSQVHMGEILLIKVLI